MFFSVINVKNSYSFFRICRKIDDCRKRKMRNGLKIRNYVIFIFRDRRSSEIGGYCLLNISLFIEFLVVQKQIDRTESIVKIWRIGHNMRSYTIFISIVRMCVCCRSMSVCCSVASDDNKLLYSTMWHFRSRRCAYLYRFSLRCPFPTVRWRLPLSVFSSSVRVKCSSTSIRILEFPITRNNYDVSIPNSFTIITNTFDSEVISARTNTDFRRKHVVISA